MRHYMRPNHARYGPTTHVVVDCESRVVDRWADATAERQVLRCWTAERIDFRRDEVRTRRTARGLTGADFWHWFRQQLSKHRRTWLWAHNAHLDVTWLGLWANLDAGHLDYKSGCFGHPPFLLKLAVDGNRFDVVDSLNWFKTSVEKLGQTLDSPKGELPDDQADEETWFKYCAQDTRIVADTIIGLVQLCRRERLGMLRQTLPSQAMASWRHTHKGPWPLPHDDPEIAQMERAAFYGGFVWNYFSGHVQSERKPHFEKERFEQKHGRTIWQTRIHCLDVRGFYPSIMHGAKFPHKVRIKLDRPRADVAEKTAMEEECLAWVKINSNKDVYPVKRSTGTHYARGTFWTCLASDELRWAVLSKHVAGWGPMIVYHSAELFTEWVDKIWALRERFTASGNKVWGEMAKWLSVSLHGKFGQRSREWWRATSHDDMERWGEWATVDQDGEGVNLYRSIAGKAWQRQPDGEDPKSFVAIPVCVTAKARVFAREIMSLLPPKSLFYHNTDSFHVNDAGYTALLAKGYLGKQGLGDLRRDRVALTAEYLAPNIYKLDDEITIAGIPRERIEGNDWQWQYQLFEGIRARLDRGPVADVMVRHVAAAIDPDAERPECDRQGWTIPPTIDDSWVPF